MDNTNLAASSGKTTHSGAGIASLTIATLSILLPLFALVLYWPLILLWFVAAPLFLAIELVALMLGIIGRRSWPGKLGVVLSLLVSIVLGWVSYNQYGLNRASMDASASTSDASNGTTAKPKAKTIAKPGGTSITATGKPTTK